MGTGDLKNINWRVTSRKTRRIWRKRSFTTQKKLFHHNVDESLRWWLSTRTKVNHDANRISKNIDSRSQFYIARVIKRGRGAGSLMRGGTKIYAFADDDSELQPFHSYRMREDVMTSVLGKKSSHNEIFSTCNERLLWTERRT
jgi:hypothetical protein